MLTKKDLDDIESVVDERLDEKLDEKLTELKSDLFDKIDPILNEVTVAREERPLIEDRIEKLEKVHPKGKHVLTS